MFVCKAAMIPDIFTEADILLGKGAFIPLK
jgi:hypothetical protein